MDDDAVVCEIEVRAPAAAVFAMFTDPQKLVRWIGVRALLEPRPGGAFRFELVPGEFCRYAELDGVTHVRLTHSGLDAAMRPMHAEGWDRYLTRLATVLEGRDPGPDPATLERP